MAHTETESIAKLEKGIEQSDSWGMDVLKGKAAAQRCDIFLAIVDTDLPDRSFR